MIVIMKPSATTDDRAAVMQRIKEHNLTGQISPGEQHTVIGIIGSGITNDLGSELESMSGVDRTVRISRPYKLASREFHPQQTIVQVGSVAIGGDEVVVIAGPCSVESEEQIVQIARAVQAAGASMLRGGAYKPRTSPYAFRGLGIHGLELLALARAETGLPIVTEVMTPSEVEPVARYADMLQIGARNMQNYYLLEEAGRSGKPILLKRGLSATIEEWLLSAEYILNQGNPNVVLCERGIRTFETATRNTLDLNAVAYAKHLSHLPVFSDPSHGTGKWRLVTPLSLASVAAGADGLILEVHHDPDRAMSDGAQSLTVPHFDALMHQLGAIATAVGREVGTPVS
ncbi:MAG: 3-deoxy-7-phosphoheptulonate synthase [Herpetosiphon sp.]